MVLLKSINEYIPKIFSGRLCLSHSNTTLEDWLYLGHSGLPRTDQNQQIRTFNYLVGVFQRFALNRASLMVTQNAKFVEMRNTSIRTTSPKKHSTV